MIKHLSVAALTAVLSLALGVTIVSAHAKYESSTPAAESTVSALPAMTVKFGEELRSVTLTVIGPDGSTISTDKGSFDLSERSIATVPLRAGGPGRYTVNWTSVSSDDGDSASGTFGFSVAAAGTAPVVTLPAPIPNAPAAPTCPSTDKPDAGFDERVNTYCKRQMVRDQNRGAILEITFNDALASGAKLEDALAQAKEALLGAGD